MNASLKVILWGQEIGRLAWDNRRRLSYFTFNPNLHEAAWDIAPLITPSIGDMRLFPVYGDSAKIYQKLPPFIADSLPDAWGNQLFDLWCAEHKIPQSKITPLEKLSFIGKRGLGALEYEPDIEQKFKTDKIDILSLVDLAQKIYAQREDVHILPKESITMQSLITVGTTAGGRQPKAVIAINRKTGEIRSGQIAGLEGYDYCIMKFGDLSRSSAELEMTYYDMALKAGIHISDSWLWDIEGKRHFLTKRFDRQGGKKMHIQTLAALYPEADSYEKLLWVCRKLQLTEKEIEEVFRRMVFNVLANNTDDHNKNFSFMMNQNGNWSLSPAYDLTYIFNYGGYLPEESRCLMIRGKLRDITKNDILLFASDNGVRKASTIIENVASAIKSFRPFAQKNGVKEEWIGRVEATLAKHLTDWGYFSKAPSSFSFTDSKGRDISEANIEQMYKGNYHLIATIDGRERKFIIRKNTDLAEAITAKGLVNIDDPFLRELVSICFKE